MNILVTGATGFLGRHLAARLVAEGHRVTALGRNARIGSELEAAGMAFFPAELDDAGRVATACTGQDAVFHCAGLASPWGPYASFHRANVLGTRHVVEGCLAQGVRRLVHVSSPSLYFDHRHRLNISEDEPLPPRGVNAYAETKRLAEIEVARGVAGGLPAISFRPRAFFGPGDTTILPRVIRANGRGVLPLVNGGAALVDMTCVENVVDALMLGLHAGEAALGRTYNITNGEPLPFATLATRLFSRLGVPCRIRSVPFWAASGAAGLMELGARLTGGAEPPLTRYAVGLLGFSQTLDISHARQQLGYEPRQTLDEGLDRFARWWQETGQPGG